MRWLLAMAMVAMLGGGAAADEVGPMEPPIVVACPHAASWPLVLECFKQHGLAANIVGTLDDANLVSVTALGDKSGSFQGFVLYVHADAGAWRIGGLTQRGGNLADYTLLRLEHAGRHGHRVDLALSQASSTSLDNLTSVSMLNRQVIAVFCNGASDRCIELVPKCEQIVHGQTIVSFEGAITLHDNLVSLKGTGSMPTCSMNVDYPFQ